MSSMIALILMISMSASIILQTPVADAHTPPWTVPTSAYITATPNPIGIGQTLTLVCWVDRNPPTAAGNVGPRWAGYKIDVTKPDGTKEVLGPWTERSATASDYYNYVPDQVGTYTFVFSWPGQTLVNVPDAGIDPRGLPFVGDFYAGSTSSPIKVTVQQDPITDWQEPALPTDYWQLPINAMNRGWSSLASSWLGGSWLVNNQQYGLAPDSPHILWTSPITPGKVSGIVDAAWPGVPTDVNDYESPWGSPIIMGGKIFYNAPGVADSSQYGYYAMDLNTGEQIWYKNGTDNGLNNPVTLGPYNNPSYVGLSQGQLYHYSSVNGEGVVSYLWMTNGNTWYMMDAATGNLILTIINVPSGTAVTDQDGSLLRYSYSATTGKLLCWNTSQAIPPQGPTGTGQQQWHPIMGQVLDAINETTFASWGMGRGGGGNSAFEANDIYPRSGYTMNLTIEKGLPGISSVLQDDNRVPKMIFGSSITTIGASVGGAPTEDVFRAYALQINENAAPYSPYPTKTATQNSNLGFTTTLLWNKNITVPVTGKNYTWSISGANYQADIFVVSCKQTMQKWGYKLSTGTLLWGPTAPEGAMNFYGMSQTTYYGKYLTSVGYSGTLYCYDPQTGDLMWTYNATGIGHEAAYGDNYPMSIAGVCDGKIFLYSTEHSPTKPLWRGSYLRCVNITDGTEMWKLADFNMGLGIANGKIVTGNEYDDQIYCIGKGPSETTVAVSPEISTYGSSIMIKGMVTDTSPGTERLAQTALYPNGVPAIADANMQAWMEHLYQQQAFPSTAQGVQVTLSVLDANGNYRDIGTTTSNTDGFYSFNWKPDIEGKYIIYASFAGSNSYWPSHAVTAFSVDSAAPTAAPTAAPAESVADMYFVPAIAGLFVLVIIVLVLLVLMMLRKRA